jgi:hypothetical protein
MQHLAGTLAALQWRAKWGWLIFALWNETVNHLMIFLLSESISVLLKVNLNAFYAFWGYFMFLLCICHIFW